MPKAIFIGDDDSRTEVDATCGQSLMMAAVLNEIEGIPAECGGSCACGTCHVYVDETFSPHLPPIKDDESAMLDEVAAERRPSSRLSCQIEMTDELDGIVVRVPR